MRKLHGLVLAAALCLPLAVHGAAEETSTYSKAHLSVELLGPGLFGSINGAYRPIPEISLTTGIGYFAFDLFVSISSIQVPIYASYLLGGKSHALEIAAGGLLIIASSSSGTGTGTASGLQQNATSTGLAGLVGLGYSYWPWDGGFHFRLTAYLFFRTEVAFWPGMTLGYAF